MGTMFVDRQDDLWVLHYPSGAKMSNASFDALLESATRHYYGSESPMRPTKLADIREAFDAAAKQHNM